MRLYPIRIARSLILDKVNSLFHIYRHIGYDAKTGEQENLSIGEVEVNKTGELKFKFINDISISESEINAIRQGIMSIRSTPFQVGNLTWIENTAGFIPTTGKHFLIKR